MYKDIRSYYEKLIKRIYGKYHQLSIDPYNEAESSFKSRKCPKCKKTTAHTQAGMCCCWRECSLRIYLIDRTAHITTHIIVIIAAIIPIDLANLLPPGLFLILASTPVEKKIPMVEELESSLLGKCALPFRI